MLAIDFANYLYRKYDKPNTFKNIDFDYASYLYDIQNVKNKINEFLDNRILTNNILKILYDYNDNEYDEEIVYIINYITI